MILYELKNYLRKTQIANIRELSLYLRAQPDAIRAMADFWIQKRCVRKRDVKTCGKSCQSCQPQLIEVYEWID